ncbi:MAG: RtcB family protein [Oscillospiraceae bacterium]|nr:RtcB family protein [Oscillospiraceae bacterium]
MFEIKGRAATAVCYAKVIEEKAEEQIRRMCDYELTKGSKIRIMPDVHAGKGCTIGTTMTVTDKVCPNIVGVDIGCGMYTVEINERDIDMERVDRAAHFIPSGMNTWDKAVESFDLHKLRCFGELNHTSRIAASLGTLGGGNHFIEIDRSSDGRCFLIIHSGSRNLGKQTAELYQRYAVEQHKGRDEYIAERDRIITGLKAQGRTSEIQPALVRLEERYRHTLPDVPEDLCWLTGTYLDDYLNDVEICQRFAKRSREIMAEIILEMSGLSARDSFHTIHNYIDTDEMILRKGAIAAHRGERVLIPINMRDGSVIATGRGCEEWNFSAPHGAGRIMSRTAAKKSLTLAEYEKAMTGIYTTSVSIKTIDEAPMAYKSLSDITDVINDSVDIIDIMKPVFNFKADDEDVPWKK